MLYNVGDIAFTVGGFFKLVPRAGQFKLFASRLYYRQLRWQFNIPIAPVAINDAYGIIRNSSSICEEAGYC